MVTPVSLGDGTARAFSVADTPADGDFGLLVAVTELLLVFVDGGVARALPLTALAAGLAGDRVAAAGLRAGAAGFFAATGFLAALAGFAFATGFAFAVGFALVTALTDGFATGFFATGFATAFEAGLDAALAAGFFAADFAGALLFAFAAGLAFAETLAGLAFERGLVFVFAISELTL